MQTKETSRFTQPVVVLCDVAPYKLADGFQRFSGIFCCRLQVKEKEALRDEVRRYATLAHLRDVLMRPLRWSRIDLALYYT
jgi:hypothetical protein